MAEPLGLDNGLTNYGDRDFARYLRRSMAHSMGISGELLSRPVIGIAASPSDFNNCHRYMPQLVEAVSRGVLAAGGLPRMFPTVSLGEVFLNPTSMVYRNLMSMDVEEMVRAQPMDAVVMIGGCDKTVPAQLMGAASANRPAIQLVTGAMSTGRHKGERLGACTDCRRFWGKFRAGEIDQGEIQTVETRLATTAGTCAVMGTASTMACIAEALGMSLPGTAAIPAVDSQRLVAAEESGKAAVRLAHSPVLPSQVMTEPAFENAFRVLMALGGSTNAIIHLTAVAGRLGIRISPQRLNEISDETPVLVDLKPVGEGYMEDFHAAGGMGAVLRELRPLLNLDCLAIDGRTLRERLDEPAGWVDRKVIRSFDEPVSPVGGLIALHGSLAPDGAIFKRAAATPSLFEKEGRAVVFESLEDLAARVDAPELDVTADDILVLKNAGPLAAGMPEAGYLPIPSKLARAGVKDMVRISDARMSGTAYGTIVLHVSPEAAAGGPLEAVRNGDRIRLSVSRKTIDLLVEPEVIARRLAQRKPIPQKRGGYQELYQRTVLQAPDGCDLDFLARPRG
ncbi:IlvD/Edd family dehydratase [Cupriavidus taiwanensis]|uniref:Putative dihydroxy-acid dehydratase n=1 Tax=Cupriavidus taiwanensis TaxID=164546 RepID=A0A7Z7JDQ1_9BURK|nr:IlvD/Edd family dehydratase [Cupriavidus taiwanensis]SOZ09088.1 putative dihydroxy-acid dehydratase [Cupriavidus taiwanensis]SOZ11297.1 putative dihydroxy-acid dehydratase [Cupriavidus taiwanensis]SOZ42649.1 putative dihydroxy-acid dehydratase [Cupriavidus taiwanensis]SPC21739.1 putative dihydroxy-acid dehydratase [Cupriavidus taiwanensis]SPD55799.1 L-arabonate dehydratase [Cupriavidus taiwanensis]